MSLKCSAWKSGPRSSTGVSYLVRHDKKSLAAVLVSWSVTKYFSKVTRNFETGFREKNPPKQITFKEIYATFL